MGPAALLSLSLGRPLVLHSNRLPNVRGLKQDRLECKTVLVDELENRPVLDLHVCCARPKPPSTPKVGLVACEKLVVDVARRDVEEIHHLVRVRTKRDDDLVELGLPSVMSPLNGDGQPWQELQ